MTPPFQRIRRFLAELKSRNVYKVAVTYLAVAFVGFQAARLLIPSTVLPGWSDEFFLFFLIIGFPVAVVVAWAFEMTAEGMRRTPEAEEEPAIGVAYRWIGLMLVVGLAGGVWHVTTGDEGRSGRPSAAAADSAAAGSAAGRDSLRPPRLGERSVAVLPFEPLSESSGSETLARGIHDDLLTRLAHISGLKVISRTAVQQYRDTDKTTGGLVEPAGAADGSAASSGNLSHRGPGV